MLFSTCWSNWPISWHWSLSIPPRNFWCIQGVQKETSSMKWVNALACSCVCAVCVCHRKDFFWLNKTKCFDRILVSYVMLRKYLCVKDLHRHSRTFIEIHKENLQTGNCAKAWKHANPRQIMATLINFLKTNSKKKWSIFYFFHSNLGKCLGLARRRL